MFKDLGTFWSLKSNCIFISVTAFAPSGRLSPQVGIVISAENPRDQRFDFLLIGVLKVEFGVFCSNKDKGLRSWATNNPYGSQQVYMCCPSNTMKLWIEFTSRHKWPGPSRPCGPVRKDIFLFSVMAAATIILQWPQWLSFLQSLCAGPSMTKMQVMLSVFKCYLISPYFRGLEEIIIYRPLEFGDWNVSQ